MKRRARRYGYYENRPRRAANWDALTNWNDVYDEAIYEEDDDDDENWPTSDGDVLGDVKESGGRRGAGYWSQRDVVPFEQTWETNLSPFKAGNASALLNYELWYLIAHVMHIAL